VLHLVSLSLLQHHAFRHLRILEVICVVVGSRHSDNLPLYQDPRTADPLVAVSRSANLDLLDVLKHVALRGILHLHSLVNFAARRAIIAYFYAEVKGLSGPLEKQFSAPSFSLVLSNR